MKALAASPKLLFRGALVALLLLAADAAVAQRPGRDGSRRGGFDPNRPMTQEEMQQRLERMDGLLQQLDTNHNGMLDADEVSGGRQQFIEGMLSRAGVELKYPIPLSTIHDAMAKSFQARVTQPGTPPPAAPAPPPPPGPTGPKAPGFGEATGAAPATAFSPPGPPGAIAGFGPPGPGPKPPPGDPPPASPPTAVAPAAAPATAPPTTAAAPAAPGTAPAPAPPGTAPAPSPPGPTAAAVPAAAPAKPRSERFLTPAERLPKGLPAWFLAKDVHGNGQITMAEFATEWTPETVAEFNRYDLNHDGIITAAEVLKVEGRQAEKPPR
jgi:hypothetical protein